MRVSKKQIIALVGHINDALKTDKFVFNSENGGFKLSKINDHNSGETDILFGDTKTELVGKMHAFVIGMEIGVRL